MQKLRWAGRLFFVGLAACIAVSLPLSASAAESSDVQTGAALSDAGLLAPARGVTRAQYITALYKAAGSPEVSIAATFADVAPDADYAPAVAWAESKGIVLRKEGDHFRPDQEITRQEAADILCRAVSILGETAQTLANSVLAAYTGLNRESDYALAPEALLEVLEQRQDGGRLTLADRCMQAEYNPDAT